MTERQSPTPRPPKAELEKTQRVLDALEACPPPRWADKLLWRGLRGSTGRGNAELEGC